MKLASPTRAEVEHFAKALNMGEVVTVDTEVSLRAPAAALGHPKIEEWLGGADRSCIRAF